MATVASGRRKAGRRPPRSPAKLGPGAWLGVLKRTVAEFRKDNVTDWAASLTYYGVLAIFPAIIAIVSVLGLIGRSATQPLITNLGKLAPGPAQHIFSNAVTNLQHGRGTAGVLFVVGIAGAVWSASGYIAAFMRASNSIYDVEEGRPIWMALPVRVEVTIVLLALLAVSAIAVVLTGGLATQVGKVLGVGSSAVMIWDIAKWPVLLVIVSLMFSILYWEGAQCAAPRISLVEPRGPVRGDHLGRRLGAVRASTWRTSPRTTRPTER